MNTNNEFINGEESRKEIPRKIIRKAKEKIKFDPKIKKGKIFSSKSVYLAYFSKEGKRKIINDRIKKLKELPDFEHIHKFLNAPRKIKQGRPCPWPRDESRSTVFWNTSPYLIKEIQKCILTNNWNNLTQCLIAFKNAPRQYHQYLFKASLINFMLNPASTQNNLLEDFLKEAMGCQDIGEMIKLLSSEFTIPSVSLLEENESSESETENNATKKPKNVKKNAKHVKNATENVKNGSENAKNATGNAENAAHYVMNATTNVKNAFRNVKNYTDYVKNATAM